MGQVVSKEELPSLIEVLKASGKKIVTTNGCFDLLHVGHVRILKAAADLGDVLIIGINSDASVKKLKGATRPINPQSERAEILASLACVDYVTIFTEDTPVEFLKIAQPNIHVKGADYKPEDLEETPIVRSFGGEVKILDLVPDHSTTLLVSKMSAKPNN